MKVNHNSNLGTPMQLIATRFMIVFEFVLGSVSFGALFATPTTIVTKLLIGSLILLFVGYVDFQNYQRALYHELALKFIDVGLRTLGSRPEGSSTSLDEEYERLERRVKWDDVAGGEGQFFALVLCGKLALWLISGSLLAIFVMPQLSNAFS